ncbi:ABC transporter substrate-binding protein [Mesorhizobium sp. NPDC059054]|uniref:ABC transporter substrate-binding protein n=1 Tax=Mesorhizobium sp. NPDC059054 TaxID=3346711 RepID=UPI0036BF60DC
MADFSPGWLESTRRWAAPCAAIAALTLSAAPVHAQAPSMITVGMTEDVRGVDPARERDGMSDPVHMHVVEGLVAYGDNLEVGPVLAQSYAVEDDGKAYVFKLRKGVKFHNGEPLTSADVKWSWDYLMAPESIWRCKAVFEGAIKVASVETPDPETIVYKLAKPNGSFIYNLARPDCAGTPVFHSSSVGPDGAWKTVVGTGPFTFGERRIGDFVEVNKFAGYVSPEGEPNGRLGRKEALVDKLRFAVVTDPSARLVGLRSGALDLTPITPQAVEQIKAEPTLDVVSSDTTVWYALLLNSKDPLLKDKRIRQAIALAIDRTAVAQGVSFGQWAGTTTPMPRASKYYTQPENEQLGASLDKAKALLTEAGYAGQPITIIANKQFEGMFDQAVIVQSLLLMAGIQANIETLEWGLQLERYTNGNYQAQSFGYSGRFDPMGAWERIIGPESRKVWKDEAAIALLDKGMQASDPQEVKRISGELYRMFMEEVPAVSLYHVNLALGVSKKLKGVHASPLETPALWNVSKQ